MPICQAYLYEANLEGADLSGANLGDANLVKANLVVCQLWGANLKRTYLHKADLSGASMYKANFQGADLSEANLQNLDLSGAYLHKADLSGANLWKANLCEADLDGANLQRADLKEAEITGIKYKRLGHCRGIFLEGCSGSPMFIRTAKDNEYVEEFSYRHSLLYLAWYLSSDCGRSLFRWIFWSLFLALYFGFNFFMLGQEHFRIDGKLPFGIVSMLYYSIVTFTTLGFGDITPQTHTGAIWVAAEVITGYVMLGGLIAILASKLARRAS